MTNIFYKEITLWRNYINCYDCTAKRQLRKKNTYLLSERNCYKQCIRVTLRANTTLLTWNPVTMGSWDSGTTYYGE